MFEDKTYEAIMDDLLDNVPADVSTEEGTIIQSALSPLAYELEKLYIEFDNMLKETFAETADYDYLELRAAERGLTPIAATYCQSLGVFNVPIPEGSRFMISDLYYISGEEYEVGSGYGYVMTCETAGTVANGVTGTLELIEAGEEDFDIDSLTSAELVSILIAARDKETQEDFLERYLDSFNTKAFGGNIADYMAKITVINGVGGAHIYPVWNGPGTVKAVIIGNDYLPASAALVSSVQDTMDPDGGLGGGMVPIGHVLTVVSATQVNVKVSATVTPTGGSITPELEEAITAAVEAYIAGLRETWQSEYTDNNAGLVVRISRIESVILNVEGVTDVANVKINDVAANLTLDDKEIPVLSEVEVV